MADSPSQDAIACVRCGEPLLAREPLCPHCQTKLAKALEVAGQPGPGERKIAAVARVLLLFEIVGSLGFVAAALADHALGGGWLIPWSAVAALAASTTFLILVGPLSILESIRRAVSPAVRKLEATVGPSTGTRSFVVETTSGTLGLLVVGDVSLALYRAGAKDHVETRELAAVQSVHGGLLTSTALVVGADASGPFGLTFVLRARRPEPALRALARGILGAARKRARRGEIPSPRPASTPPAAPAQGATGGSSSASAPPAGASSAPGSGSTSGP